MIERPTAEAHRVVSQVVKPGDLVVDATAGNGHDTLFLAGLVGESGRVLAFDVQEAAILSTRKRVDEAGLGECVELRHESHGKLLERVGRDAASAVMFNLGYLPGGDHALITEVGETCKSVVQALFSMKPGGVMTVVCYTGHPGGQEEADAVIMGLERIRDERTVGFDLQVGEPARENAPFLVVVRKLERVLVPDL